MKPNLTQKLALVTALCGMLLILASGTARSSDWIDWQPLPGADDREAGGIDMRLKEGSFEYGARGENMHLWTFQFRNRYQRTIQLKVELNFVADKGPAKEFEDSTIKAGQLSSTMGTYIISKVKPVGRVVKIQTEDYKPFPGQTAVGRNPAATATAGNATMFSVGQRWPGRAEAQSDGNIDKIITRNSPEFVMVRRYDDSNLHFDFNAAHPDNDHYMTPLLHEKVAQLAQMVAQRWPGVRLNINSTWNEGDQHTNGTSIHYEGRAADLAVYPKDSTKLGELADMAKRSGFTWVWYEDTHHIHASVPKE